MMLLTRMFSERPGTPGRRLRGEGGFRAMWLCRSCHMMPFKRRSSHLMRVEDKTNAVLLHGTMEGKIEIAGYCRVP